MKFGAPAIRRHIVVIGLWASLVSALPYCSGNATVTNEKLYEEPPCDLKRTVSPGPNASLTYTYVALSNLSFCCKSNYTTVVPLGTNVTALDEEAEYLYSFVDKFLQRYDCSHFYPFHSCEFCKNAYRTWVCSLVFPMKCLGPQPNALQTCNDVCLEVQRKCPSEMLFTCPLDDNVDDNGDGKYGSWEGDSDIKLFGSGGCNPMHYNLGPGSQYGSARGSRELFLAIVLAVSWIVISG